MPRPRRPPTRPPSPLDLADLGSSFAMTAAIHDPADDEDDEPARSAAARDGEPATPGAASQPAGASQPAATTAPGADTGDPPRPGADTGEPQRPGGSQPPGAGGRASGARTGGRSPISFLARRRSAEPKNRRAADGDGGPDAGASGDPIGAEARPDAPGDADQPGRRRYPGEHGRTGADPTRKVRGGDRSDAEEQRGRAGNGYPRTDPEEPADRADDQGERGLRGLVGGGSSQVGVGAAMRARDAARPTDEDLAAAEAELMIVRRGWVPREDLPPRGPRR